MAELEKRIEQRLVRGVSRGGGLALKFVSPGWRGVPDRIVALPGGRLVFVELKAETGRLSVLQERMISRLRALGQDVRVVRGRAEVDALLEELVGNADV